MAEPSERWIEMKPDKQLTFEVGKHYKTRDGKKATVYLIRPTYMVGEIEGREAPHSWNTGGSWGSEPIPYSNDLVDVWREPARVMVLMYRNTATGKVRTFSEHRPTRDWELIAQRELVEGEGME
jgi:hypothetical protein